MNDFKIENFQEIANQFVILAFDIYKCAKQIKKQCQEFSLAPLSYEEKINLYSTLEGSVFLEPEHEELFLQLSTVICEIVPLNQFVVTGCFIRAVRKWQFRHKKPIISLLKEPRIKQLQIGSEILEETTRLIGRLLRKFPEKDKFLHNLFLKLIDQYDELLSVIIFRGELDRVSVDLSRWR